MKKNDVSTLSAEKTEETNNNDYCHHNIKKDHQSNLNQLLEQLTTHKNSKMQMAIDQDSKLINEQPITTNKQLNSVSLQQSASIETEKASSKHNSYTPTLNQKSDVTEVTIDTEIGTDLITIQIGDNHNHDDDIDECTSEITSKLQSINYESTKSEVQSSVIHKRIGGYGECRLIFTIDARDNFYFKHLSFDKACYLYYGILLNKWYPITCIGTGMALLVLSQIVRHSKTAQLTLNLFDLTTAQKAWNTLRTVLWLLAVLISFIFSLSYLLTMNKKMISLVMRSFDFWFKMYNSLVFWIAYFVINSAYPIPFRIFYIISGVQVMTFLFLLDAMLMPIRLKLLGQFLISAYSVYGAISYFINLDENEFNWKPFENSGFKYGEYANINFKNLSVSAQLYLAIFTAKPIASVFLTWLTLGNKSIQEVRNADENNSSSKININKYKRNSDSDYSTQFGYPNSNPTTTIRDIRENSISDQSTPCRTTAARSVSRRVSQSSRGSVGSIGSSMSPRRAQSQASPNNTPHKSSWTKSSIMVGVNGHNHQTVSSVLSAIHPHQNQNQNQTQNQSQTQTHSRTRARTGSRSQTHSRKSMSQSNYSHSIVESLPFQGIRSLSRLKQEHYHRARINSIASDDVNFAPAPEIDFNTLDPRLIQRSITLNKRPYFEWKNIIWTEIKASESKDNICCTPQVTSSDCLFGFLN